MRLHSPVSKKGKRAGQETWTLYIEDRRGESRRAERRKRTSALSADFTPEGAQAFFADRKSTRLNSSHVAISYAVFCLRKKENIAACASPQATGATTH